MSGVDKVNRYGFTIVELLIVIVVIGILAAISIVAYSGIQDRANDMAIKNDLANIAKKYELFKVDHGRYPNTASEFPGLDLSVSKSAYYTPDDRYNLVPCSRSSGSEYSVTAIGKSGKRFYVSNGSSVQEYTGAQSWTDTTSNYTFMCTSTLTGSSVVSSSSGFAHGAWRNWTN